MAKSEVLAVRITDEKRKMIEARAKELKVKVPRFVNDAIEFYGSFNPGFLEQIQTVAGQLLLPVPTVLQNLLMSYMASEKATLDVFPGGRPKAFQRAFQFEGTSLIVTDDLSEKVYAQAKRDAETVKRKLEDRGPTKNFTALSIEEGALISSMVANAV